ncbi:hypothetical protein L332_06590 [Agrococcus pavilionensis RW1]|uniref:Uncharacterized protein n=1 Tax=Agrococcus pavilionensis RW1 TaxID=1330458 RepID=U1MQA3_9MICO|nr:hypothetical protein [Agrococcus pavilionensis]ERG64121.1 hypothetical protein L332_06590 [Agrococcus pavilionensis RW1]
MTAQRSAAQPSAFGARRPSSEQQPTLLQQIQQREQQHAQSQEPPADRRPAEPGPYDQPLAQGSMPYGSSVGGRATAGGVENPYSEQPSSPSPWPERPAAALPARRIFGIQPVLFVGICLLAIVTLVTVVLIFVGDFESQASRVVWTVVVFLAFTGLLALDLVLARRSATPLIIGVAANIYLLAVLMISIWMRGTGDDPWDGDWLFGELFGITLLTILVVRAAAAGAWGLISLGERGRAEMARIIGLVAAALLGLVGILLTLHFAIEAFGFEVTEWYWRATVAAIVVTALAASVTVLLFWNRRNIDWQEAEARGEHVRRPAAQSVGGAANPTAMRPGAAPAPMPQAPRQPAPQPAPQPGAGGLLPWPTYADGTPFPMGPDGQPVFPPQR